MPGVVAILVVLAMMPILVCLGSGALAAVIAWSLDRDGRVRHEGSELLDVNT